MSLLRKRPWLLVVLAFVVLIAAWTKLFFFAQEHGDHPIPLTEEAPP